MQGISSPDCLWRIWVFLDAVFLGVSTRLKKDCFPTSLEKVWWTPLATRSDPALALLRRNHDFGKLALGLFFSTLGDAALSVAVVWRITMLDVHFLPLLGLVVMIPRILTMIGGWVADHVPLRRSMMSLDLFRGIVLMGAALGVSHCNMDATVFIGIASLGMVALADAVYDPARMALMAQIVEADDLLAGNGIITTVNHSGRIAGQLLGGLIMASLRFSAVLWTDAATFVISALLLGWIHNRAESPVTISKNVLNRRFLAEFSIFWRVRWLMTFAPASVLINIVFSASFLLLSAFIKHRFHATALRYSLFLIMWSVGQILGAMTVPRFQNFPVKTTAAGAACVQGLCFMVFVLSPNMGVSLAAFMGAGYANSASNALKNTLFMRATPLNLRGRLFGFLGGFVQLGTPLAPLLAALILDHERLGMIWIATAVVSFLLAAIYLTLQVDPSHKGDEAYDCQKIP